MGNGYGTSYYKISFIGRLDAPITLDQLPHWQEALGRPILVGPQKGFNDDPSVVAHEGQMLRQPDLQAFPCPGAILGAQCM